MTLRLVDPPPVVSLAAQTAATGEAWAIVVDAMGRALATPNLPYEDTARLQRCYRLACALGRRAPLVRAEGGDA
jgi:hypothetical protein